MEEKGPKEQIKYYMYAMKYYSAIKKKKQIWVSSSEVDEPRACYTGEVSQKEKNKYGILIHIYEI